MRLERMGLAALVVVAGIGACAATPPPVAPRNGDEPPQNATPTPTAGELGALARLAMQTLSQHLSVPVKDVEVVTITPIEWRDSSMGCPKPDRGYMQVITPGHVAVVAHGGRHYDVHMSGKAAFVCEPQTGKKREATGDVKPLLTLRTQEQLEELATQDLAARLGAPAEEIKIARSRQVEWPDTSLGCPQPNETPMRQRTKGYLFELTYRGRPYVYHADLRRVLPCPPIASD
jgi:hypothetical protein